MTQGYESWRTNAWVMAAVAGTIAAVAGMMWSTIYSLLAPHFHGWQSALRGAAITLAAALGITKFGLGPLTIILLATIVGLLWIEPEAKAK